MNTKDFEKRIKALEAEVEDLKAERTEQGKPWYEQDRNRAVVLEDKSLVESVLKAIMAKSKELKGKKVPYPLWSMARGVTDKGWTLSDKQVDFAFKLINTKNVAAVRDILVA